MRRIFCAHDVTYQSLGIHTGWHDMCCRQHRGQTPYLSFAGICHLQGASWTSSFWGQFRPWNAVRSIPCAVRSMINCDCYKNATNKTMKCSCLQWRNAFPSYETWSLYDFRSSSCFSLSTTFVEFLMHLFGLLTLTVYTAVFLLVNNLPQLSSVPAQEESYYLKWKMLTKVVYRHPLLLTNFVSLKQSSIVIVQTWGGNIAGEASNLSGGGNPSKYHHNWATEKLGWEEHLSNREFPANQHSPTILKMKQHSKIWFVFKAFKHIYRRYDSQQDDGNY